MTPLRRRLFAVLGVLAAAAGARAADATYDIRDQAGLFSPEAVQKALQTLRHIPEDLRKIRAEEDLPEEKPPDFVIETAAAPPEDVKQQLQGAKTNAQKEEILNSWGRRQAEAEGVDGVYVLLCKDVVRDWLGRECGYAVAIVQPEPRAREFTPHNASALQFTFKYMTSRPDQVKKRDAKLLGAATQVRQTIDAHLRPPFPWLEMGAVLACVLALWGLLGMIRLRLDAAAPASGTPDPLRPALFNGLLGGMFGTVAAHWIYDTLFIAASRAAPEEAAAPPPPPEPTPAAEPVESAAMSRAERLDLTARDDLTDEPSAPAPTLE